MADFTVSTDLDTFMQSADKPAMRTNMDLGTAATKDVAATGDAASGEVVKGDDSRLTDARTPVSHTHTLSDVTDSGTAASKDVPATGDAAAGEVVLGNDSRLTDARTPTSHTHTASEVTDFDTEVANNTTVAANTSKLSGIEAGAEVNNISDTNATDLTDGGDSTLHYHSADRARANHTGTQTLSTISDAGTAASKDVPATGDAAAGEVVLGNDSRLTDARTPTSHTHTASEVTDFDTEVANNSTVAANTSKLAGIEAGAEVNNISDTNATDLTDGGDSTLHYHSADRNRSNHTGTQTLSTISDAGTIASQDANSVTITGGSVTGITDLAIADGGTGAGTAAGARTNLEVYSDAEVDAKVATKAVAGGVELDGTSKAFDDLSDSGSAVLLGKIRSFSCRIKTTSSSFQTIFSSNTFSTSGWELGIWSGGGNDGKLYLQIANSGTRFLAYYGNSITDGEWHEIVLNVDWSSNDGTLSPTISIYVDGSLASESVSTAFNGTYATTATTLRLLNRGGVLRFVGQVNNIRIFNRALSASEVAELYDSGTVAVADRWGSNPLTAASFAHYGSTDDGASSVTKVDFTTTGASGYQVLWDYGKPIKAGNVVAITISNFASSDGAGIRLVGGSAGSPTISAVPSITGDGTILLTATADSTQFGFRINAQSVTSGSTVDLDVDEVKVLGCIADLPLDEGIGYQFHDRSSNHFDALASTTGVTHLVPKTEGKVRVKAADASSAMYMLRADSILPTDSIISNVLSEQCYVDLTNSAQVLDDYRIRLNPSGSDLQIQRSDGSNHATLGTVTAPSSLSDVDVQIHYEQVAR